MLLVLLACSGTLGAASAPPLEDTCAHAEVADGDVCVPQTCGVGEYGALTETRFSVGPNGAFNTIQAAADAAGDAGGGIVAIAAGEYRENISLNAAHDDVTLAGRCRELVTIDASDGGAKGFAVHVEGTARTKVEIRDMTVRNAEHDGIRIWGGKATLERLQFAGVQPVSADFSGFASSGTLHDVEFIDAAPDDDGLTGLLVRQGA